MPTQNALINTTSRLTIVFHTFILTHVRVRYPAKVKCLSYRRDLPNLKRIQNNLTYFLSHSLMSNSTIFGPIYIWHKQIMKSFSENFWEESLIWFDFLKLIPYVCCSKPVFYSLRSSMPHKRINSIPLSFCF